MAKSGNNENKIEKLVRVGFYELEKTIGKGAVECVASEVITERYLINTKSRFVFLSLSLFPSFINGLEIEQEKEISRLLSSPPIQ